MDTHTDNARKIAELIKDIDFGMLTTIDAEGRLHSRPMSTNRKVEFNGDLWFFTDDNSPKIHEIENRPRVNVSFAEPKTQTYVSLSGTAELVRDRSKMEELWEPELKAWFPQGLDTPGIGLLKINADQAEYWGSPGSPISHAIGLVKALATGQRPQIGENEKVSFP